VPRAGRRSWTRLASVAGVLLIGLLCATRVAAAEFHGQVIGVTDGDTITVLHDGRPETVRLQGIDAPEKSQAFGQRAKQFTASLASGKTVAVRIKDRDRYGRTVGEVTLPDGRNVNQELVRAGYAWWYRRYSSDPRLGTLEAEARAAHLGLWADAHPLPPWEWRRSRQRTMADPRRVGRTGALE